MKIIEMLVLFCLILAKKSLKSKRVIELHNLFVNGYFTQKLRKFKLYMTVKGVQEVLVLLEIVKIYAKNRKWKKKNVPLPWKSKLCLKWKRKKKNNHHPKMWWILKGIKAVKPLVLCWAPSRCFVTRSSLWLLQPSWLILLMPAGT